MASTLRQKWFLFFVKKAQNFVHFRPYELVQILPACGPNTHQNVWRDFRLPVSAFATVARKSFKGNFTAKIDFLIGYFLLLYITDGKSLHTLFDKYLDHMMVKFEQNHMVKYTQF